MRTKIRFSFFTQVDFKFILLLILIVLNAAKPVFAARKPIAIKSRNIEASTIHPIGFSFQEVINGLNNPLVITNAGDGSGRLFIAERGGRILIFKNGSLLGTPFLDIQSLVESTSGEEGLLGLAFHPSYESNGKFYVFYTAPLFNDPDGSILTLRQYSVSTGNPDAADPTSGITILTINHPTYSNHNGGTILFGNDGYLYWSVGDGGSGGDPFNNSQNLTSLLGKILRIDVNSDSPYSIPESNPFYNSPNQNIRKEIWAYGLRNPWRISFDRVTHDLYIGDVGQQMHEEINFQPATSLGGENYGWRIMEGSFCYNPAINCDQTGKALPVAEYDHTLGCSITGGHVYRGSNYPDLTGYYFFGDFCSGRLFGVINDQLNGWSNAIELADTGFFITAFGEDEQGELYLSDYYNGKIYAIQYSLPRYSISGNTGINYASLAYVDDTLKTTTTDSNGNYSFTVPYGWSGSVTPTKPGFTFTPTSRNYSNITSNQTNQDYLSSWVGSIAITSDKALVSVGRPHIGSEVASYDGFSSGSTTAFVPMLFKDAFGGDYDAALYIQNVSSSSASVTLEFYDTSGSLNCTKTDSIAALASKGYWLPSVSCTSGSLPSGWVGGVKVSSDQPIVAVGRPHIGAEVMTYNGFSAGSTSAFIPMLFKDAFGGSYDSAFYIQNVGTSSASVTIQYFDNSGSLNCTKSDSIASFASKGYWLPSATCDSGSLPTGWVGGVKVSSDQPIVTVGRPHIGSQITTYDGFSAGSSASFVPMLFKGAFGGSYDSAFYLQNTGASSASVTIEYYDNAGSLNCTKSDTIAPLASKGYWLPSATCDTGSLPAGWVGGVKVSSDQPVVAVGRPHIGSQITTYNGFSSGALNAFLPMLFKDAFGGEYDSAFYLQNTEATVASVTIQFFDNTGTLTCSRTDTIQPKATLGFWVPSVTCFP